MASVAPPPDPLKDPIGYAAQQAKASARLKQAMEVKRATWVAKCWKPSARANPEPAKQTFQVRVLFDTSGRRADFAVGEPSAKSRSDVASCLRDNPPDVTIEAPKAPIGIQQSFELP